MHDFSKNILFILYSIDFIKFHCLITFALEILGNICVVIICCPGRFSTQPQSQDKNLNIERRKKAFNVK